MNYKFPAIPNLTASVKSRGISLACASPFMYSLTSLCSLNLALDRGQDFGIQTVSLQRTGVSAGWEDCAQEIGKVTRRQPHRETLSLLSGEPMRGSPSGSSIMLFLPSKSIQKALPLSPSSPSFLIHIFPSPQIGPENWKGLFTETVNPGLHLALNFTIPNLSFD